MILIPIQNVNVTLLNTGQLWESILKQNVLGQQWVWRNLLFLKNMYQNLMYSYKQLVVPVKYSQLCKEWGKGSSIQLWLTHSMILSKPSELHFNRGLLIILHFWRLLSFIREVANLTVAYWILCENWFFPTQQPSEIMFPQQMSRLRRARLNNWPEVRELAGKEAKLGLPL